MFWKEFKRMRKRNQKVAMRVHDRDGGMLVEGNPVSQRWSKNFDRMLNLESEVQVSIIAVDGDRRRPVFWQAK